MSTRKRHKAVFVLTGRGLKMMLDERGSQAWKADARSVNECEYVVCIQNHKQPYFTIDETSAAHHTAFLVARLAGVTQADPSSDPDGTRKKFLFGDYAEIKVPNAWSGQRNPVAYDYLDSLGIDPDKLDFKPMPEPGTDSKEPGPLTIAQAKQGLALHFGVPPEAVEIIVRG